MLYNNLFYVFLIIPMAVSASCRTCNYTVVCYVGLVYPWPHFGLLSRGEAVRDEPAQYISIQAPETTVVVPNGSHYRDSQ